MGIRKICKISQYTRSNPFRPAISFVLFSIINMVPIRISATPTNPIADSISPRKIKARNIAITFLVLSTGITLLTFPSCNALK